MKICENGTVRDMTSEEIARLQAAQLSNAAVKEPTNEEKLALMLDSIDTEPLPTEEPKVGYKWQMMYTQMKGFVWELVEDPDAVGTQKNPLYWIEGMTVKAGYWYTADGDTVYICVADGTPSGISDTEYFDTI